MRFLLPRIAPFRTVQSEEFEVTRPGTYTASVRIPAGLLAETVYGVNAAINLRTESGPVAPLSQLKALSFRVYDAVAVQSARGAWRGNMPGVVAPRLTWQVAPAGRSGRPMPEAVRRRVVAIEPRPKRVVARMHEVWRYRRMFRFFAAVLASSYQRTVLGAA